MITEINIERFIPLVNKVAFYSETYFENSRLLQNNKTKIPLVYELNSTNKQDHQGFLNTVKSSQSVTYL